MPSTQEMIELLNRMQQQAQQNLPTTPNNGNPMGVYNTSPKKGGINPRIPQYPWLEPDPAVQLIDQMIAPPVAPMNPAMTVPQRPGVMPVLPAAPQPRPVLPNTNPMLPNVPRVNKY